jgi:hypothetical protein
MKYPCLAYGDEKDWKALTKEQQESLLGQDEVLRKRGVLMAAVRMTVTTVRAWDGNPTITGHAIASSNCAIGRFFHHRGG